ncbi:Putative cytochrome P450 [Septoria linicola]|uniref:Cytochrome P450 n=1 Tax=Septoria linicola TaxID=215465 RepID=A0A9Q9APS8_9PEZI|nr:putative cytochrome P450 [Septoria linicola]USW53224.1 Putative cytochrome P450 [Septoria linicola]
MGLILLVQKWPFVAMLVLTAVLGSFTWLMLVRPIHSSAALLTISVYILAIRPFHKFLVAARRSKTFSEFAKSKNCVKAPALPTPFLGAIRYKIKLLLYPGGDLLDDVFAKKYERYGPTHALHDRFGVPKVIHTVDPVNINVILRSRAEDWCPAKGRANTMYPLAQEGLLNSEGEAWMRNRKLILRHINTKRVKDVREAEPDVQLLFDAIGPADSNGWTETVDLLDLFHRMSLDMSTTYLLGTSANAQFSGIAARKREAIMLDYSLVPSKRDREMTYEEAYDVVRNYFSWRSKLGSKYWLADSPRYRKACSTLNEFADGLIKRAMDNRSNCQTSGEPASSKYGLIDSLVKEIGDPVHIRNLVMDLFIAGQNMTGTMVAWVFAQLSVNADLFVRLRAEVLDKFGTEEAPRDALTWDNLQSCSFMQNVIRETLRMYPLLANIGRIAKCDTVLPRGDGTDGLQPIAVPTGCAVTCNIYLTHRRTEEWGEDAWEFKPDRWIGRKLGPEFAPFGAGPRVCIGQQLTMSEISFVIARMMQRFSEMRTPEGQDNLTKGYRVVVAPKNGVKVQLRLARDSTPHKSPLSGAEQA